MSRVCDTLNTTNASGLTIGTGSSAVTLASTSTSARVVSLPDATDTLVGLQTTDVLTNKTMTSTTNNVISTGLFSATTAINVSGSAAPTAGQILKAVNSTSAIWQDITLPNTTFSGSTVSTTNDITTTIETIPTIDNTTYYVVTNIIANDGSAGAAGFTMRNAFRRGTGAVSLVQIGSTDDIVAFATDASWDVQTNVNTATGNIEIQVRGAVATNIDWKSSTQTMSI